MLQDNGQVIRTNNHLEIFHGKMKKSFGNHPNIKIFLEGFNDEHEAQKINLRLLERRRKIHKKVLQKGSEHLARLRHLLDENELKAL